MLYLYSYVLDLSRVVVIFQFLVHLGLALKGYPRHIRPVGVGPPSLPQPGEPVGRNLKVVLQDQAVLIVRPS